MNHHPPAPVDAVARAFKGARKQQNGEYSAWCPCCDIDCITIADSKRGHVYLYCPKGCTQHDMMAAAGLGIGDLMGFDRLSGSISGPKSKALTPPSRTPDPVPLQPIRPEGIPFPEIPILDQYIDALVERSGGAPRVLCAQCVLAAVNLAVQHIADVELPGIGGRSARRPVSNFFLTVARSGERKTSIDRIALEGIEAHRIALEKVRVEEMARYKAALWQWEQEQKQAHASGIYKEGEAPEPPREAVLMVKEPTQEGLFRSLSRGQLSQGLFNDEGGAFLGGYGMSKDHRMKTAATLNALWDGAALDRPRAKDHETLRGRRFCLHLMMQLQASEQLIGDAMLRDIGFTARCLTVEPESTIGSRPFHEAPERSVRLGDDFRNLLLDRLNASSHEGEHGLEPRVIGLSETARRYWIEFYNVIEELLATTYRSIQGFAGKAPEHALRLAAMLTLFENASAQEIGPDLMLIGIELAFFYVREQLRLEVGRPSERDESADLLLAWMRERGDTVISIPDICRTGPSLLRKRDAAQRAVETCVEAGWLTQSGPGEVRGTSRRQTWTLVQAEAAQ